MGKNRLIEEVINTFIDCVMSLTLSNLTSVHVTGLKGIELDALQDCRVIFEIIKLNAYGFAEVFIGRP